MVQVSEKITLRVKLKKTGALQYISHLDLVRTMNKIIVRAKLPLWYTEGFNPKPKMAFAAPLSIGTESMCEYMDLRLTERIAPELALEKLNANMTDEMQAVEAYYPETKFTDMRWLEYTVRIKTDGASEELAMACEAALNAPYIEVMKRTKSGDATVDIRPLIRSAEARCEGDVITVRCVLSADPSSFLNPEYVIKALRERVGILSNPDLTAEYYSIMRERAYDTEMREFR